MRISSGFSFFHEFSEDFACDDQLSSQGPEPGGMNPEEQGLKPHRHRGPQSRTGIPGCPLRLLTAEYILHGGNEQVLLCERGIRTFEDHTRFTLSLATVPSLHQVTHLPVVVDPSHAAGHADLVPPLACAAVATGADGILIEVHPHPEKALSDGHQALRPEAFASLMIKMKQHRQLLSYGLAEGCLSREAKGGTQEADVAIK
jgi:hypothetical protein